VSRATQAGFDQHILKPIDLGKVRQVLRATDAYYAQGAAPARPTRPAA
jgi:hypothetical protein